MDVNTCRICLNKSATVCIFENSGEIQRSAKIMRCANIAVEQGDGLPAFICCHCEHELAVCYQFVLKCEAADRSLRNLAVEFAAELFGQHVEAKIEAVIKNEPGAYDDFLFEDIIKEDVDEEKSSELQTDGTNKLPKKVDRRRKKRNRSGPTQCVVCGLMVNSRSAMDIHSRTHTGEKPFECPSCDARFPAKGHLKRHIETFHTKRERKFTCETCGNSFFRKNDIIIHMRRHTGETPYACPYCPKKFQQIATLIRHKRIHTGDKPYSCPVCAKTFADKSMVTKHMYVHSDERRFSCHLCDKSVKTKGALAQHLNLHSNEKLNVCSFCGTSFAAKGNLKAHILRVHSEKSGQCNVCLKTFSNIEAHMPKHTGEKPFECALCKRAFSSKRSVANHILFKHQNVGKYKCSMSDCPKTFPTQSMLEFHLLKQHTNHTPFICQHCSRGFFRASDLSRHLRVSHMDLQVKTSKYPTPTISMIKIV